MKVGIYTDSHYSSAEITCKKRYNSRSLLKIKAAYDAFTKEGCELIVCLGDLIDKESSVDKVTENLGKISKIIGACPIPTVALMGNHDAFIYTPDEFYKILGTKPPMDLYIGGRNFIFLDACYFKSGAHYAPGDSDWTDTFLPCEEALKAKLDKLLEPAYIFIHQNIDPNVREDHRIFNSERVFDIINQSGNVKSVFQGHYHAGMYSVHSGIEYVTFPAMCENEDGFWIIDI